MSNFLKGISLFVARDASVSTLTDAAPSLTSPDGDGQTASGPLLPAVTDADSKPTSRRAKAAGAAAAGVRDDAGRGHGREAATEVLTRVAYPIDDDEAAPRKSRPSRALNLLRTSTQVAVTPHPLPAHSRAARAHGPQSRGVILTETERVRLQVMQVQIRLGSLDLYEGPIDGMLNPDTVTGVRYFQTLKGMRDTGLLTAGTINALGVPPLA